MLQKVQQGIPPSCSNHSPPTHICKRRLWGVVHGKAKLWVSREVEHIQEHRPPHHCVCPDLRLAVQVQRAITA
jgi:hypothetical protein